MSKDEKFVPTVDKPVDFAWQNRVQNENFAALSKGTFPTQTVTSHIHTHIKRLKEAVFSACSSL